MGGGRGFGMGTLTYNLDGKESITETSGQNQGSMTLKAKSNDKGLELSSTRKANFQGNDVTITNNERWELSSGGTLTIKRTTDNPRGTQQSTLVFTKQ